MTFESILNLQRENLLAGITKDVHYRKESLERLLESIVDNEPAIYDALYKDFGKSYSESCKSEVNQVKEEIQYAINHLEQWSRPQRVKTPFHLFPSKSYIYKEPYGVILIIAPLCNPVGLSLIPLVGAIAAGNCVVVKCSKKCANTSAAMASIINSTFDMKHVYAVDNSLSNDELMSQRYEYIFYTGSARVGKNLMKEAASTFTPITLQLGGKNPCIIGPGADLDLAVKNIIDAKLINAGQTCTAPDYVVVPKQVKEEVISKLTKYIEEKVKDPFSSEDYPRIANLHQFMRLTKFLVRTKDIIGGRNDDEQLKIEPTIFPNADFDSEIMKEEIFGPLLPVISYTDIYDVTDIIRRRPKPLSLYVFSNKREFIDEMIDRISCGNCCINDCDVLGKNPRLPFGGVGSSGMGKYHGQASFETFSNTKSVTIR